MAVSLGGPESLLELPGMMSHEPTVTGLEERTEASIANYAVGLIRMRHVILPIVTT